MRWIVTLGGIGYLRPAPGTWASVAALLLGLLLHRLGHFPLLAVATLAAIPLCLWSVDRFTAGIADPDRPEIVIDELVGQWIALCAPSLGFWLMGLSSDRFPWPGWVAAFAFFRLFDIWKPWLVGRADRRRDAAGVLLDDVWAGIFAAAATMLAAGVSHGIMGR